MNLLSFVEPAMLLAPTMPQASNPSEPADVVVNGQTNPYQLTAKQIRRALDAYRERRAAQAPASTLYFEAIATRGARPLDGLKLTLRSAGDSVPVSMDGQHQFVLQPLAGNDWALVANRRRGTMTVLPLILTAGTTAMDRRLGDMRLGCDVFWAMVRSSVPLPMQGLFSLAGGCRTNRIPIWVASDRAVQSVTVVTGQRRVILELRPDHRHYRLPLGDRTLPDDARVQFVPI